MAYFSLYITIVSTIVAAVVFAVMYKRTVYCFFSGIVEYYLKARVKQIYKQNPNATHEMMSKLIHIEILKVIKNGYQPSSQCIDVIVDTLEKNCWFAFEHWYIPFQATDYELDDFEFYSGIHSFGLVSPVIPFNPYYGMWEGENGRRRVMFVDFLIARVRESLSTCEVTS